MAMMSNSSAVSSYEERSTESREDESDMGGGGASSGTNLEYKGKSPKGKGATKGSSSDNFLASPSGGSNTTAANSIARPAPRSTNEVDQNGKSSRYFMEEEEADHENRDKTSGSMSVFTK